MSKKTTKLSLGDFHKGSTSSTSSIPSSSIPTSSEGQQTPYYRPDRERASYGDRLASRFGDVGARTESRPDGGERGNWRGAPRDNDDGERGNWRQGGDRPFNRDGGDRPFNRDGGERSFNRDGGERSFNRDNDRPERTFSRDMFGAKASGESTDDAPRRPFNRDGGDRPFNRDGGDRPFNRDGGDRPRGDRPPMRDDRFLSREIFGAKVNTSDEAPAFEDRPRRFGDRDGDRPPARPSTFQRDERSFSRDMFGAKLGGASEEEPRREFRRTDKKEEEKPRKKAAEPEVDADGFVIVKAGAKPVEKEDKTKAAAVKKPAFTSRFALDEDEEEEEETATAKPAAKPKVEAAKVEKPIEKVVEEVAAPVAAPVAAKKEEPKAEIKVVEAQLSNMNLTQPKQEKLSWAAADDNKVADFSFGKAAPVAAPVVVAAPAAKDSSVLEQALNGDIQPVALAQIKKNLQEFLPLSATHAANLAKTIAESVNAGEFEYFNVLSLVTKIVGDAAGRKAKAANADVAEAKAKGQDEGRALVLAALAATGNKFGEAAVKQVIADVDDVIDYLPAAISAMPKGSERNAARDAALVKAGLAFLAPSNGADNSVDTPMVQVAKAFAKNGVADAVAVYKKVATGDKVESITSVVEALHDQNKDNRTQYKEVFEALVNANAVSIQDIAAWKDSTANKSVAKQAALMSALSWISATMPAVRQVDEYDEEEEDDYGLDDY